MNIEEYAKKHSKISGANISEKITEELDKLPKGSKILDIGCAEGFTIKDLYELYGDKFSYTGIDLSKTRIDLAKKQNIPNSTFIVSNAEAINLEKDSFDCILCSQVLEHVENEEKLLSQIKRLLKPGGIYQIDTVYKKSWAWYFYKSPGGWAIDPTHLREYTDLDSVRELFERNDLLINDIYLERIKRNIKKIGLFDFKFYIPGYYILFVIGSK